jgi:hypothetical protein
MKNLITANNYKNRFFEIIKEDITKLSLSQEELNDILKGYLETAIWTEEEQLSSEIVSIDDNDEDDENTELEKLIKIQNNFNSKPLLSFITDDIDVDSKIQAYNDIKKFLEGISKEAFDEAIKENDYFGLGMDIWLTRNGHGSGFFDRGYEHKEELEKAAKDLKESDLYITDDYKLAFSN